MLEQLISLLERIANALEKSDVPAPAPAPTPAPTPAPVTPFSSVQAAARLAVGLAVNAQIVTREVVGKALIALATSKGRDAAVAALATFNAKELKDVPEASYPALLDTIAKAAV
jgi:hypothetical protein